MITQLDTNAVLPQEILDQLGKIDLVVNFKSTEDSFMKHHGGSIPLFPPQIEFQEGNKFLICPCMLLNQNP